MNDKLDIFNELITSCLQRRALLKRTKISRPPAPWLKDLEINDLRMKRNELRFEGYNNSSEQSWTNYRSIRNTPKKKI